MLPALAIEWVQHMSAEVSGGLKNKAAFDIIYQPSA
jgi:hypothetical protein